MTHACRLLSASASLVVALGLTGHAEALTFNFVFDGSGLTTPAPPPTAPFVGTGSVSFDGDLGSGDFLLSSLTNLDISFQIDGRSYTEADITTTTPSFLRITGIGDSRTAVFWSDQIGDGGYSGAIDLVRADGWVLSFGPDFSGSGFADFTGLYQIGAPDGSPDRTGSYAGAASEVPLPASLPMLLLGLTGLAIAARRRN